MKKIFNVSLFVLLALVVSVNFMPAKAFADIPPGPEYHQQDKCNKIVNLDQYPDLIFIQFSSGPYSGSFTGVATQIKNNECFKFGRDTGVILWTTKEKFNSIDLKNLKMRTEKLYFNMQVPSEFNLLFVDSKREMTSGYVKLNEPTSKEVDYYLSKDSNGTFSLSTSEKISVDNKNNNLKPVNHITPKKESKPTPAPIKQGFWHWFMCLFKSSC